MFAVLRTKLQPPHTISAWISRPHLLDQLTAGLERRLILVSAPAGCGKTSLLSTWLSNVSLPAAWLSLDGRDSNLVTFLTYFVAAIHTLFPQSCEQTLAMLELPQLPTMQDIANSLVNEISALRQDFILVLDDYHLIHKPEVHKLLFALVYRLPAHLHLVISSRTDPPLPFARLRAQSRLAEVRTENLRFSAEEAQALVEQEFGASVATEAIELLIKRTEGWAVGLQLAALSMRGHNDPVVFARAFRDNVNRHILEYLTSDVLARQPETIQDFLLRTSIFDQFSASLGDAIRHDDTFAGMTDNDNKRLDSAAILKRLERSNLFVMSLDDNGEWYRYHHLFKDTLHTQLTRTRGREFVTQLHMKAGVWFANQGLIQEALQHALAAGDAELAATWVERYRHDWLNNERWNTLERALSMLPDGVVQVRPALLLAKAFVWQVQGRITQTKELVDKAEALLEASTTPDASLVEMRGEIDLLRSFAAGSGRAEAVHAQAQRALERLPVEHAYARGNALVLWCMASQITGHYKAAARTLQQELDKRQSSHSTYVLRVLFALTAIHYFEGRVLEAATVAGRFLKLAAQDQRPLSVGWARYFLGLCCYEQNDLDGAAEHFGSNARQPNSIHVQTAHNSFIGLALTLQARGQPIQANEQAKTLSEFHLEHGVGDYLDAAQSFRARLALLQGDPARAIHWARTTDANSDMYPALELEHPAVTRARALIAAGTPEDLRTATTQLDHLLASARSIHAIRWEIEILALQALALNAQGKTSGALDALEAALTLANPPDFIRTFVDLGPSLADLLRQLIQHNRQPAYAVRLLDAFPRSPAKPAMPHKAAPLVHNIAVGETLIEPLTERELQVLGLLTQRLSNKEIAAVLFIAEGTVKNHVHVVFQKLGVKRRLEAVHRAQALDLMSPA